MQIKETVSFPALPNKNVLPSPTMRYKKILENEKEKGAKN